MTVQERTSLPAEIPGSYDLRDLSAPVIPAEYGRGSLVGGAVVSHLCEPVYTVAFPYPEKIDNKEVVMHFLVSGFSPKRARSEQIEDAFGDSHRHLVYRQLDPEEIEACGDMVLRAHNGIYSAPLTKGSAVYQLYTNSKKFPIT